MMRKYDFKPRTEEADRFWHARTPGLPLEHGRPYPVNVPANLHRSRPHPGPFARSNNPAIKTWPLPSRPKHLPETITDDEIAAIRAMPYAPSPETTDPQPIGPIPAWVRKYWKGDKPYPKHPASDEGVRRSRATTNRIASEHKPTR